MKSPAPVRWIHGGPQDEAKTSGPKSTPVDSMIRGYSHSETVPQPFAEIEEYSLRELGRRSLSKHELEMRLCAQKFDPEEIASELERLEACGILDDEALAARSITQLRQGKQLGRAAIKAELARRGIAPTVIAIALESADADDEPERAYALAAKRAPTLRGLDHETATRRLSAYLLRRGYDTATVRAACTRVLSADGVGY